MSRLKNFPEKIYLGMTPSGEVVLIPADDSLDFITLMRIRKTAFYNIGGSDHSDRPKRIRKPKAPTNTPQEPDNQPAGQPEDLPQATKAKRQRRKKIETSDKAEFRCDACGKDVENPLTNSKGKVQCPLCLVVGKIVGKED